MEFYLPKPLELNIGSTVQLLNKINSDFWVTENSFISLDILEKRTIYT